MIIQNGSWGLACPVMHLLHNTINNHMIVRSLRIAPASRDLNRDGSKKKTLHLLHFLSPHNILYREGCPDSGLDLAVLHSGIRQISILRVSVHVK